MSLPGFAGFLTISGVREKAITHHLKTSMDPGLRNVRRLEFRMESGRLPNTNSLVNVVDISEPC